MKKLIISSLVILGFTVLGVSQNKVSTAFSTSYTYEYNKDYISAIAEINNVFLADSYEINLRLGWLYYLQGDFVKSQTHYKNAIQLKPNSIEAKQGYINSTAYLEKWDNMISTYQQILTLDPKNYTANTNLATYYFNLKDFVKAKKHALIINELYPFDYTINILLGKINIGLGNINDAKNNLDNALLYNPTSTEVLELLKKI